MSNSGKKRELKNKLFKRTGWQDSNGDWFAMCAFGCGDILTFETASLDRHPIKGEHGGEYVMSNLRLACIPCNSRDRNHKECRRRNKKKNPGVLLPKGMRTPDGSRYAKNLEELKKFKNRQKLINIATHNVGDPDAKSFLVPQYPFEVKRILKENYPKSEGLDKNGIDINRICGAIPENIHRIANQGRQKILYD